jgi:RNA polymerase sigma-70 factor (ECF subfamily)
MKPSPPLLDDRAFATADDQTVVAAAVTGSQAAARELVKRFERPVYNLLVRLVRDRSAAEDLSQETFLKFFRTLRRYDPQYRLAAWMLKIAHNTGIDYLRRHRPELVPLDAPEDEGRSLSEAIPDPSAPTPAQVAERMSLSQALDAALERIRPEYRTAIVLRHQEELDYVEIAHVTGWPIGTVKTYLHRARLALARELEAAGWAPLDRSETRSRTKP